LIRRDSNAINELFNDTARLKKELKYNADALNDRLNKSFEQFREILQAIVDKFYYDYYEIRSFVRLDLNHLNETINENKETLNGIIKLKDGAGLTATKQDIVENPHNVEIYEVEAAQIPRSLDSVDFACMNGNFALQANYKPSDALATEDAKSEAAQTYANIIAVSEKNKDAEWAKTLVEVLHSKEIQDFINKKYEGGVVPIE